MSEHTAEKDAPQYLRAEWEEVCLAKRAYLDALAALRETCEHETVLKFTSSEYRTTHVCEDCGYHETVQWDSGYKYKDWRLLGRAYDVSWPEVHAAFPKVRADDRDATSVTPPGVGKP